MKALVITKTGGPEALEIRDMPAPEIKPGQTAVRVSAGGLNFADLMTTQGGYPGMPAPPFIAGREFSGIEEQAKRRVMGYMQWGAFGEIAAANSNLLWPVPDHWSCQQAAAFPVNYFTAFLAYWEAGITTRGQVPSPVQPRMSRQPRVLIHAVAGGVGTAAVQIGKLLGVEMYGTSSSQEKLARVKELGLQHGINYRQTDYQEAIKSLTNGEGVDAVFEMLGGEHTTKSLHCLRDFGRVIQYGSATGKPPQLDLRALYAKSRSIQGLWLTYLSQKKEIMDMAWQQLSQWIAERKLSPVVGCEYAFEDAIEAYRLLEAGKNYGKVVLKIG